MSDKVVLYEVSDHIATITLNRPEALNAWTGQMDVEYRAAFAEAEKDDDARVIIVTGAGKGFCAGADMGLLQSVTQGKPASANGQGEVAQPGANSGMPDDFRQQYSWPPSVLKPVIGAINGAAVGLGFVHALFCDIRFCSDKAKLGAIFGQRGLIAEYGLAWMLPRLIGMNHAMDLMYTSRVITAQEAHAMGLVSRVVPVEKLMDEVREYATLIASTVSPRSTAIMKKQAYTGLVSDLKPALDMATDEMLKSLACNDFKEGVASFLERRAPHFTGK